MPESWFVTGVKEVTSEDMSVSNTVDKRPNHVRETGVNVASGCIETSSDGTEVYICWCYGDSSTLDSFASFSDTSSLWAGDLTKEEVANHLNTRFGLNRSFSEWVEKMVAEQT